MIEQVFLTNQKLEMNMPQIFKTKCIVNFRKNRNRKKGLDLREQKWQNQMKLKKNEELISGYQEAKYLWNGLPPSQNDINLRPFSIQLEIPSRLKILPRFFASAFAVYTRLCNIRKQSRKSWPKKKFKIFNFLDGFLKLKIANQILFSYEQLFSTWFLTTRRHVKLVLNFLTMS